MGVMGLAYRCQMNEGLWPMAASGLDRPMTSSDADMGVACHSHMNEDVDVSLYEPSHCVYLNPRRSVSRQ